MLERVRCLAGVGILVAAAFVVGLGGKAHAEFLGGCLTPLNPDVPVICGGTSDASGTSITKTWTGVPTDPANYHFFGIGTATNSDPFFEDITNATGVALTDYHIVFGADQAFTMGDFTLDMSATIEVIDAGGTSVFPGGSSAPGPFTCPFSSETGSAACEFSIFFDVPLADGANFTIDTTVNDLFFPGDPVASFFTVTQYPTVTNLPEPGALAIFGLGLAALGMVRRRRAA